MHRANEPLFDTRGLLERLFRWGLIFAAGVAFFSLIRFEFLAWNWKQFQAQSGADILAALAHGLRFDMSASLMLMSPWILASFAPGLTAFRIQKRSLILILFIVVQLPFWALNFIDAEFINFVGRRFTASSLYIFREFKGGGAQSFILPYWHWIVGELVEIAIYFWVVSKILKLKIKTPDIRVGSHILTYALICLAAFCLTTIGVRGGIQRKPLSFVNAHVFLTPVLNNLVLNSTFTVLKTLKKDSLPRETFFANPEEMKSLLNGSVQGKSLLEGHRTLQKPNVVILILESFALEYMGEINHKKGFTPFLDELAKKSLFFTNAFANGRRSIEGIGSIYAGIPALMDEPFISSEFSSNYFLGLGTKLGQDGYHTSFFHGAENGSMYFDSFMKSAGVQNYFGAQEYPNPADNDGAWGIYDEPFLHFFAEKLTTFPEPFFAGLFTLSSHPPYKLPENLKSQFPPGPVEISASIEYTDWALKKFFAEAATKPWFKNTLFIITADHTQINYLPEYDNTLGHYRVPLIFYHPAAKWPAVSTTQPAQHIDIFPTLMDILGMSADSTIWLGRSLFVPGEKTVTNYLEPGYLLVAQDQYVIWNRPGDPQIFSMQDLKQGKPLPSDAHLENRLKASLQYFSQGLWDQKLYYPSGR